MSTNYARAKYQEIYDVNTKSNEVSLIGIHTPVGAKPRQMLSGFFTQFRKYKYSGCSVIATPSARLPLSLAQISVEAGTSGINPKDIWNPILVRGCHGDNLNAALNSIYKGSFEYEGSSIGKDVHVDSVVPAGSLTWEQMYYRMLQDPSFKKFSMSSGIKLTGLHPMVYNVASNHQIVPSENGIPGVLQQDSDGSGFEFGNRIRGAVSNGESASAKSSSIVLPTFLTNRLTSLGWLDTRQVLNGATLGSGDVSPGFTTLPKIFMACIILPMAKSAETVTSMRFVVTHYFEFKEFNTSLTLEGASEYYDWLTNVSKKKVGDALIEDPTYLNDTLDTNGESDSVEIVSDGVF